MKRIALIPAYEPEETMLTTIEELSENGFSVVVVNDGSAKDKDELFEAASGIAVVLTHPENRGKGAAIKTGIRYLMDTIPPEDWSHTLVVTVDADGQHRSPDVIRTAEAAAKHPGALFLGSRHFTGKVPLRSRFGNSVTRVVFRLAARKRLTDTQTGLRAFTLNLGDRLLAVEGSRYEYEMNMLLELSRQHIPIKEVPIETVYIAGNASSHFRAVQDSLRIYGEILKFSLSSLLGFLTDFAMFAILSFLTAGAGAASVTISNVGARIVSASVNFSVNRRFVFRSRESLLPAAIKYALLAAGILAGNTLVLSILVTDLGVNRFAAKLITEITFFMISWLVQKYLIFQIHRPRKAPANAA